MITIDELLTPSTEEEIFEGFLASLEAFGIPARSWRQGGTARYILRIVAVLYAAFTVTMVTMAKAGFLPTATGGWLTALAFYVYGVSRREATYASGTVTIDNTGGGIYNFNAGAFIVVNSSSGKSYANVDAFTIPSADSVDIEVKALELGSDSNSAPNEIDTLGTGIDGVVCFNPAAVLGSDEQTDESLREECLNALGARSPKGPRSAYEHAIQIATLPDDTPVNVNRWRVSPYSSTGRVDIVIASPSGPVTAADITGVTESVEENARPDTAIFTVTSATGIPDTRTLTVWATKTKGIDADMIQEACENAIINLDETYPIGGKRRIGESQGYLFTDSIEQAAKAPYPGISDQDRSALATIWLVESDGSDLPLALDEVAQMSVAFVIRITDGP